MPTPSPPTESSSRSGPALEGTGPVVRLSVSIRRDGTASITALPPASPTSTSASSAAAHSPMGQKQQQQPVQSNFSAWEAAEAEETMRMLRWVESSSGRPSTPSMSKPVQQHQQQRSSLPAIEPDEVVQMPEIPEEVIDISSQNAMSSIDGEDASSLTIFASDAGEEAVSSSGRPRGGNYDYEDEDGDGTGVGSLTEMFSELSRVPALIETIGRDQLIFHVPDDESGFLQQQASRMASGSPFSAGFGGSSRGGSGPQWGGNELQTPFPTDDLADDDGEEIASTFELVVPVPRKQEVTSGGGGISPGMAGERMAAMAGSILPSETFNLLADQVAQSVVSRALNNWSPQSLTLLCTLGASLCISMHLPIPPSVLQEATVGRTASREEIAEALREVVRRVASGEPVTSVDVAVLPPISEGETAVQPEQLSDSVTSIK